MFALFLILSSSTLPFLPLLLSFGFQSSGASGIIVGNLSACTIYLSTACACVPAACICLSFSLLFGGKVLLNFPFSSLFIAHPACASDPCMSSACAVSFCGRISWRASFCLPSTPDFHRSLQREVDFSSIRSWRHSVDFIMVWFGFCFFGFLSERESERANTSSANFACGSSWLFGQGSGCKRRGFLFLLFFLARPEPFGTRAKRIGCCHRCGGAFV